MPPLWSRRPPTPVTGQQAEQLARRWLEQQGLVHLESNWRCRLGEIDLIMRDHDTLVFIEVRYRKSAHFGGALASVTGTKQRKLIAAAGIWLSRQRNHVNAPCRFDVLGLEPGSQDMQYQWVKHAFTGDNE